MRAVARHDYDQALRVERWPLHEVLLAFEERLRENARRNYRTSLLMWASLRVGDPPQPPSLLDD